MIASLLDLKFSIQEMFYGGIVALSCNYLTESLFVLWSSKFINSTTKRTSTDGGTQKIFCFFHCFVRIPACC